MSILDRTALDASPLADLHAIASELSIDGYRRLRRAELIDAILQHQEGGAADAPEAAQSAEAGQASEAAQSETDTEAAEPAGEGGRPASSRRRGRRGARGRGSGKAPDDQQPERSDAEAEPHDAEAEPHGEEAEPHGEGPKEIEQELERAEQELERAEQEIVEGVVELLPGGSGFVRVTPPDPSDDDVYISSAQVKRCELVSGDRVSGPRRAPRRSERFASLVRVDTVNGRPASELADGVRFEELPLAFPDRRLELAGGDPVLEAIGRAVPIGRGSRVTIVGPAASGKSEVMRRLAKALAEDPEIQLWLVLVGVRPEELPEWQDAGVAPAASLSFSASADAQSQALEGVVEQVRRLVARGSDAAVLIDTLDGVLPAIAGKALASARNVVDGGSLTVIATASRAVGGETGVITLERTADGAFPAIDPAATWTLRRERLG